MSLSNHFIEHFEQLPIVARAQIAANMNFYNLMKLAFKSRKWRRAIGSRNLNQTSLALKIFENYCVVFLRDHRLDISEGRKALFLFERDSVDVQEDDTIRMSDNCYHQNLREVFHFFYTKIPTISYSRMEIPDAKCLRISDFLKINFFLGTFGANRLKTRDLRVLLLHWFNGDSFGKANHYTFQMSQEQVEELDMNVVLKDFNAVPWNPKRRDRKFLVYDSQHSYIPIDLADGYDIRLPDNTLTTIYLNPNTRILHFCRWNYVFVMEYLDELALETVVIMNQILAANNLTPEERLKYEGERRKDLQSLRNLRDDQNLDVADLVYVSRGVKPHRGEFGKN